MGPGPGAVSVDGCDVAVALVLRSSPSSGAGLGRIAGGRFFASPVAFAFEEEFVGRGLESVDGGLAKRASAMAASN